MIINIIRTTAISIPPLVNTYSISFDGLNDRISMGDTIGFERTDAFSISCWVKTTDSTGYMVSKALSGVGYLMRVSTGHIRIGLVIDGGNQIDVITPEIVNDNIWHHVVATYDGSSLASGVNCYIDGVASLLTVNADTLVSTIINTYNFTIGADSSGSTLLSGNIDEVSVYDKELSLAEVQSIYNYGTPSDLSELSSASNLMNWWRMGDGDTYPTLIDNAHDYSFPTLADECTGGYHGTATSMAVSNIVIDSTYGKVTYFLGSSSDYVTMGDVLDKHSTSPFSISCWVKSSLTSANQFFFSKYNTSIKGWGIRFMTTGSIMMLLYYSDAYESTVQTTTTGFNNGVWHHVVATMDGSATAAGTHIYVDGVDRALTVIQDNLTGYDMTNTGPLNFGTRSGGVTGTYLTGYMHNAAMWNKALSSAEVTEIYAGATTPNLKLLSSAANLEAWWKLGSSTGINGTMTNMTSGNIVADVP